MSSQQYGPDHVLMGTDYPYDMGESRSDRLCRGRARARATPSGKLMFGGNAARLLGLEMPADFR